MTTPPASVEYESAQPSPAVAEAFSLAATAPAPSAAAAHGGEPLPNYPRISNVMDRLRSMAEAAQLPADQDVAREPGHTIFDGIPALGVKPAVAVPADRALAAVPTAAAPAAPAAVPPTAVAVSAGSPLPAADGRLLGQIVQTQPALEVALERPADATTLQALRQHVARLENASVDVVDEDHFDDVDDDELLRELNLRETAREALRARMIHHGAARQHYSAYDVVVMMMGFGVMVLLSAPPIIRIVKAIQGMPVT